MRLRSVLSLVGCVLALQATSPAYGFPGFGPVPTAGATTDEKGRYVIELGDTTIHGTLWLDENIDGIRQPSESVLAHELVLGSGESSVGGIRYAGLWWRFSTQRVD